MDDSYSKLKKLVDEGRLRITYADTPPRSASTAFFSSFAELMDGAVFEPFHFNQYAAGFEAGLDKIYKAACEAGVAKATPQNPTHLVVKEIARYLSDDEWKRWMPLVQNFIVPLRDPQLQMSSLMVRMANDLFYGKKGMDGLTKEQAWNLPVYVFQDQNKKAHFRTEDAKQGAIDRGWTPQYDGKPIPMRDMVDRALAKGCIIEGFPLVGGYQRSCWTVVNRHLCMLEEHLREHPEKKLAVLSSFLLRTDPENLLRQLVTRLDIPYTEDEIHNAVENWGNKSKKAIRSDGRTSDFAWTGRALLSDHMEPPLEETPLLSKFPRGVKEHISQVAMPAFIHMLSHDEHIGPKTPSELKALFEKEYGGIKVLDRNPVTAYAMMATLVPAQMRAAPKAGETGGAIDFNGPGQQREFLAEMRTRFPQHLESFDLVDRVVAEIPLSGRMQNAHETAPVRDESLQKPLDRGQA